MISIQTAPLVGQVGSSGSCRLILSFRGSLPNVESPLDVVVPVELLSGLGQDSSGRKGRRRLLYCDGFSHVVSNKSTMQVNRKTSCFCMQDKEPLLLRGHTRACT
jgi:hypothetical protein